jgi:polar amino acid transport system substrate-binding protein
LCSGVERPASGRARIHVIAFAEAEHDGTMIDAPGTFRVAAAAILFVPALLWAVIARDAWVLHHKQRSPRVAHEIRNPVTAARSLAQQLAREPGVPFVRELDVVVTELDRIERQVGALLRFACRDSFAFEPVDLVELVRATVEQLRRRLDGAGIAVALELGGSAVARADREKVRQLLINVIENAMDAVAEHPDGRRLVLGVGTANGAVYLSVADNGPGVPAEALPRLFEPFFSLKAQGTGLGLAIVQRTVDAHGGRVVATCPPGGGLALRSELPAAGPR